MTFLCSLPLWIWMLFFPSGAGEISLPTVQKTNHQKLLELVRQNAGHVTLLNVWATWCDPCREEMPQLVKLRNAYADSGL
ncbi:MAG TPA: TlpA disulfide reductase family protein, partial [Bacteroidota bacterium]|nr:TlpA disulfide reductase family protein [Bacteroidota bacterium]